MTKIKNKDIERLQKLKKIISAQMGYKRYDEFALSINNACDAIRKLDKIKGK